MFYYLSLAIALFTVGVFGLLVRRNLAGKLVGLFLMTNAMVLLYSTFSHFIKTDGITGPAFVSFILLALTAELVLGAFIFYRYYRKTKTSDDEGIDLFN